MFGISRLAPGFWLSVGAMIGLVVLIEPLLGPYAPHSPANDYVNHVALVAAAHDTWQETGALPISSDKLTPGIEYPYFLLSNGGLYIIAGAVTAAIGLPPYLSLAITLAFAYILGLVGMYAVARSYGVGWRIAVFTGASYALSPYIVTTLLRRFALPEYLLWELLPIFYLGVSVSVRKSSGLWIIVGAVGLAAPFYIHKLLAPYAMLVMVLGLPMGMVWNPRRVLRLTVVSTAAILLTGPAWLPMVRGLDATVVSQLGGLRPIVLHESVATLLWPMARPSLRQDLVPVSDNLPLQTGVIPVVGLILALLSMVLARDEWFRVGLGAQACAMVVAGMAVVEPGLWSVAPRPLAAIQFTYRLIGVMTFLGHLLLVQGCEPVIAMLRRRVRRRVMEGAAVVLVMGCTASLWTYWGRPERLDVEASRIAPADFIDHGGFYSHDVRSTIRTARAIYPDGWLRTPPEPVVNDADRWPIYLVAQVPEELFSRSGEPMRITVYGLGVDDSDGTRGRGWSGRWMVGQYEIGHPGTVMLRFDLGEGTTRLLIECSRTFTPSVLDPASTDRRALCINILYLGPSNAGVGVVLPMEWPGGQRLRGPLGGSIVHTYGVAPGHYMLPIYYYPFVRVVREDGRGVPNYRFGNRLAVIVREPGPGETYYISFDLLAETLLAAGGGILLGVYVALDALWRKRVARRLLPQ
jgi:hypothetical protein